MKNISEFSISQIFFNLYQFISLSKSKKTTIIVAKINKSDKI